MDYPYIYGLSDDDSSEAKQDDAAEAYKFEGFEIEVNVKVVLNPVTKIKVS
ncbi:hypothetical protein HGH93_19850 [Chitinophaga polysaccharea]|uniref:hypothetical protein n=1 Tax=Chitinophaga TaxID=79328 RepID=UPI001454FCDB|nr:MULTISPECIES: hypothetical protein [Chitinophaga]NLR60375.1 hypothetical protein [Chitinophaga polysaccharea]NLU96016.1 hypothetical protein [Chitinophaga sp. Ak27]